MKDYSLTKSVTREKDCIKDIRNKKNIIKRIGLKIFRISILKAFLSYFLFFFVFILLIAGKPVLVNGIPFAPVDDEVNVVEAIVIDEQAKVSKLITDEGITKNRSHFPKNPEIYIPMPIPEKTEKAVKTQSFNRLVSKNLVTGIEIISEAAYTNLVEAVDALHAEGSGGIRAYPSNYIEENQLIPLNFSDLTLISNPEDYPWCVNVKLWMTFPSGTYTASGVLIDPMHVLTAGHCVYYNGEWATSIVVVPAYENGIQPYGDASAVQIHTWTEWIENGNFDHDMGVIDLDRPIGGLTGWHGYGYNNNPSFYTGNTFHNPGYPAESPYNGQYMYYRYGNFDYTESILGVWYGNEVGINKRSYQGQSGSGAYYISSGRIVYAVLSNGNNSETNFPRITSDKFANIQSYINFDTPSTFDLIPMDVTINPTTVTAGNKLSSMSYIVHNYSSASWSGTVNVKVYLSTNDNISSSDTSIQTQSFSYSFSPKSSAIVYSPAPTIPLNTSEGNYWIGVILDISDYNNGNNDSDGQDASNIYVDPAPGVLSVSPADGLSSSGTQGGPFSPSSKSYTLKNIGGSSLSWSVSKEYNRNWVTVSPTSGVLSPDYSTTVTVSINSNANSLSPDSYSETVNFKNTTNGRDTSRSVSLTVKPYVDNKAPIADAGVDQVVNEGITVTLDGSNSYDEDDGIASYSWLQLRGTSVSLSDSNASQTTFTSPPVGPGGESLTFQLNVTDFDGQQSSDTCIVNVTWQNIPPIADAGPNQEVNAGELVTLDGNNSYDLDGTITSYLWTQLSGTTVILSNNSTVQPIFVSPNFGPEGESLTFQLTVTDDGGLQSKDTCIVNIIGLNSPPVANAGPNQEVNEGELVTLDGNNSYDSDGTIASYLWTQLSGTNVTLSNVTAAQPTFTSLNVGPEGESLTFRLTVTDDGELQSTDTCIINIIGLNSPPVANAGPDQAINEGVLVTLDGNGSYDKDGTITSYSWTQLSGPPIELSDNIVVKPSFTSPNVGTEGESLTFQLNVTDDGGLLNSDKVSIEISDVDGEDEGDGGGAFCFIATASFGSPMEKEVEILRRFRDRYLYTNKPGKAFTALYYKHSPRIAEYIDDKDSIKAFMRIGLYPAIGFSYFMVETKLLHKLITMILLTLTSGAIIVLVKKWRRNITIQSKTGRSK